MRDAARPLKRTERDVIGESGDAAGDEGLRAEQALERFQRCFQPRLVGSVIGLEQAGAALAAMDGLGAAAGMTVIEL